MSGLPSTSMAPMGRGESAVTLPSKLTITRAPGVFELSWKWREQVPRGAFFAPLLPAVWTLNSIVQVMRHSPAAGVMLLGGVFALLGGTALAWAKNTMRIRVSQGAIEMRSGPISARGTIEIGDGVDVLAVEGPSRNRKRPAPWGVNVVRENGKVTRLVAPMLEEQQAHTIAQMIAAALRGEDAPLSR